MPRNKRLARIKGKQLIDCYYSSGSEDNASGDCNISNLSLEANATDLCAKDCPRASSALGGYTEDAGKLNECNNATTSQFIINQRGSIRDQIAQWAIEEHISSTAINKLLSILKPVIPTLPLDSRTLKQTPRNVQKYDLNEGYYIHYGVKDSLTDFLLSNDVEMEVLELNFNVDGLPLVKSTGAQVWPILMNIKNTEEVMLVGVFESYSKPKDISAFLKMLVDELKGLQEYGFEFRDKFFLIKIGVFICDAPARAMILEIKQHSGYFSCHKCTITGEQYKSARIFPNQQCEVRTNEDFRSRKHIEHHKTMEKIALEDLSFDLVSQFPHDYMHVVCLGVVKSMIKGWVEERKMQFKISAKKLRVLNARLLKSRKDTPREFARRPRSIFEFRRWKATEFRYFLLYIGPIMLKGILDEERFHHFVCLSSAIRLLLSNNSTRYKEADKLLSSFREKIPQLYDKSFLTYNMHSLSHIATDCMNHGNLHKISAFKYENFLGGIKRKIKKNHQFGAQIYKRMVERSVNGGLKQHNSLQIERVDGSNLSSVKTKEKYFSLKHPDNFYMFENNVFKIESLVKNDEEAFVCGRMLTTEKAAFGNDIKYCTEQLLISGEVFEHKLTDVKKIVKIKLSSELYFVPVIHD